MPRCYNHNDRYYQAYGNLQLLRNPFKEQVVVHRAETAEQHDRNRRRWLHTGANGGVLVSPFHFHIRESRPCRSRGRRSALHPHHCRTLRRAYKPAAHDFDLCAAGRMLIISINQPGSLSRATCLAMNELAGAVIKI